MLIDNWLNHTVMKIFDNVTCRNYNTYNYFCYIFYRNIIYILLYIYIYIIHSKIMKLITNKKSLKKKSYFFVFY